MTEPTYVTVLRGWVDEAHEVAVMALVEDASFREWTRMLLADYDRLARELEQERAARIAAEGAAMANDSPRQDALDEACDERDRLWTALTEIVQAKRDVQHANSMGDYLALRTAENRLMQAEFQAESILRKPNDKPKAGMSDGVKAAFRAAVREIDAIRSEPLERRLEKAEAIIGKFIDCRNDRGWRIAAGEKAGPNLNDVLAEAWDYIGGKALRGEI